MIYFYLDISKMPNRTCFSIIAFWIFLFSLTAVYADSRTVDINECIDIALQNNPDILEIGEERKKSLADYQVARANRGIKVDGQLKTIERMRAETSSDPNARIPGKDTDIGIFAGLYSYYYLYDKKKEKSEEVAKVGVSLTKIESERIKEDVVYGVKKAYFEYLMAKDNLIMREKLLEKAKEKQKLVHTLYNAGLQPALDVTQMNVSYSQAMLDFERAKNDEKIHISSLYIAMGLQERGDIVFAQVEKEYLPEIKYSVEELNKLALLYSPELRIFKEKKKISRLNIEIAEAERKPSVFISIGLGLENKALYLFNDDKGEFSDNFNRNNWEPVFTTAITASLPVYYGGAIIANIDSAAVEYNRLVYQERGVQIKVRNNIERQYESINELKKQIQISKMIIENSEKHALLARRNYENGVTTLLDLQNAESGVINAQLEHLSCVYQYYMTLASISYTLGVGEEKICHK
jgi:outer membrane protein TolC